LRRSAYHRESRSDSPFIGGDEAVWRRVLVGLNRQERLHAMTLEIFLGRGGPLW
jgi:hypothetical protein